MVTLGAPYIAGFLAFRETPHLLEALRRLERDTPSLMPQVPRPWSLGSLGVDRGHSPSNRAADGHFWGAVQLGSRNTGCWLTLFSDHKLSLFVCDFGQQRLLNI